ncbi:MAG: hypothetical protein HY221_00690, partial [Candidatus Sungbacteria bacterium]|nr:hypothetical protein [Candidatus Sungbacteria bacterium]
TTATFYRPGTQYITISARDALFGTTASSDATPANRESCRVAVVSGTGSTGGPPQPDYTVKPQSITISSPAVAGSPITLSAKIQNIGDTTAPASLTRFCLYYYTSPQGLSGSSPCKRAQASWYADKDTPALAAGATSAAITTTWPGAQSVAGTHTLFVCANVNNLAEKNPDNNCDFSPFTVAPAPPTPPTVTLTASANNFDPGGKTRIRWETRNATSCGDPRFNGNALNWAGSTATSGVSPEITLNATATFSLTCRGPGGSAEGRVTVNVTAAPAPDPIITLTATPEAINPGQSARLRWASRNATSCGGTTPSNWTGSTATAGGKNVSPTSTTAYTIRCTNAGRSAQKSVTVTVTAPQPLAVSCSATPNPANVNQPVTFTATVTGGGGGVTRYEWLSERPSETPRPSNTQSVTQTFTTPGDRVIGVYVTKGNENKRDNCRIMVNGSNNHEPIAQVQARVSYDGGRTYTEPSNHLTLPNNQPVKIQLLADQSSDPDDWDNPTLGVSNGGKCEYDPRFMSNEGQFQANSALTVTNPTNPQACNKTIDVTIPNIPNPSYFRYQPLRITDRQGARSSQSILDIEIVSESQTGSVGGYAVLVVAGVDRGLMAGVKISLLNSNGQPIVNSNGQPVGPQTTDANGGFLFTNIPLFARYTLKVDETPVGYTAHIRDINGSNQYTFTLIENTGVPVYLTSTQFRNATLEVDVLGDTDTITGYNFPVPGAQVVVESTEDVAPNRLIHATRETDQGGAAIFRPLAAGAGEISPTVRVTVRRMGYQDFVSQYIIRSTDYSQIRVQLTPLAGTSSIMIYFADLISSQLIAYPLNVVIDDNPVVTVDNGMINAIILPGRNTHSITATEKTENGSDPHYLPLTASFTVPSGTTASPVAVGNNIFRHPWYTFRMQPRQSSCEVIPPNGSPPDGVKFCYLGQEAVDMKNNEHWKFELIADVIRSLRKSAGAKLTTIPQLVVIKRMGAGEAGSAGEDDIELCSHCLAPLKRGDESKIKTLAAHEMGHEIDFYKLHTDTTTEDNNQIGEHPCLDHFETTNLRDQYFFNECYRKVAGFGGQNELGQAHYDNTNFGYGRSYPIINATEAFAELVAFIFQPDIDALLHGHIEAAQVANAATPTHTTFSDRGKAIFRALDAIVHKETGIPETISGGTP